MEVFIQSPSRPSNQSTGVKGLHSSRAFLTGGRSKCFETLPSVSPIHAHVHTRRAVSDTQSDSLLVGSSKGEVLCSGTPRHSVRRSRGLNQQPSSQPALPPEPGRGALGE